MPAAVADGVRYHRDPDGVVTLTIDLPGQSANTMTQAYVNAMGAAVGRLEAERAEITGVVVTSAKQTFFAGGDLDRLIAVTPDDAEQLAAEITEVKGQLRRLETLGRPVAAAINGAALGGGLEIALACHHRVLLDDPAATVGFPEVTLGLLPGAGGVVRLTRLLGLSGALPLLTQGTRLRPGQALEQGLVHELATDRDALLAAARAWVLADPDAGQPWDRRGFRLPGGGPTDPAQYSALAVAPALLHQQTRGALPAPEKILAAAVEGALVDIDTALAIETRYFVELATGQVAKNMIGTFWFALNEIKAGRSRPRRLPAYATTRVGVLGAGLMGAGIAQVSAAAGLDVVLKDVDAAAAQRGKDRVAGVLDQWVRQGTLSPEGGAATLARITPTGADADLTRCDLVIEAVFEDRALKGTVLAAAAQQALPDAVIASNTSTLPITGLATAVPDPARVVGLHFFSPVHRMPLVEIIRGDKTSAEALARAFDFVLQIKKTPIVVNDSRGFFTSRVFAAYALEGIAMLAEGVHPAVIENTARQAGQPVGPLAVSDEVSLTLMWHIREQTIADLTAEGRPVAGNLLVEHPAMAVLDAFVNELCRPGKAAGAGFYDYPAGAPKRLWPELFIRYHGTDAAVSRVDIRDRLLFVQSVDALRCLEEGVLTSVADANVGSIFGIGFPAATGGVLQFVEAYGRQAFVDRADQLAQSYGDRFDPPAILRDRAASGEPF